MRYSMRWLILSGLLVATAASAGVSVQHATQADFSQFRTFTFVEGTVAVDPQLETWLHEAVTQEMRNKGLQKLAEGGDLLVRTHLTVREEQRLEVDILGQGSILEPDSTKVTPGEYARNVGRGTVVVELLDGYSKLLVWQGMVGAVTGTEATKASEKRIHKAIGKLFKKYPPR